MELPPIQTAWHPASCLFPHWKAASPLSPNDRGGHGWGKPTHSRGRPSPQTSRSSHTGRSLVDGEPLLFLLVIKLDLFKLFSVKPMPESESSSSAMESIPHPVMTGANPDRDPPGLTVWNLKAIRPVGHAPKPKVSTLKNKESRQDEKNRQKMWKLYQEWKRDHSYRYWAEIYTKKFLSLDGMYIFLKHKKCQIESVMDRKHE